MKEKYLTARWNNIFPIVPLSVAVFLVIAVLTGMNVPLAEGGFTSFTALVVIGGIG